MNEPIIEFKNVSKIYDNGAKGLKDINLSVKPNEFIVIVGLSGAGKSTLLRSINQLQTISSGDVLIAGESIVAAKGKKLRELRRNIGMIFQSFNLVKQSSVQRNVMSGRVGHYSTLRSVFGLFSKEDKLKVEQALKKVQLLEKIYTRADALSGGQQQRVAIARALVQDPKIILADEPIASLDPLTAKLVLDDLRSINEELGITIMVNLHSKELAKKYATRIIGLRDGELIYDKPIDNVTDSDLDSIYDGENTKKEKVYE
ncbi:phosphonates import ATP-binding protein PhnC [Companilactobacillus sp. RD055328]|uniref:phosphonate ABC transporter ATP-binding protein n=1 Tax=Companilactobacillus sp. RD055328 TaxID=2916634 RepID=UPI001FC8B8F3|nr:phosphonate ABC transporter ATP-binding protein [Companilactobacillus sp. RD055328]GKQ43218.1 phosphonates import ATP-binding protein PhnC [Companilactobacillus sp. RD055328]